MKPGEFPIWRKPSASFAVFLGILIFAPRRTEPLILFGYSFTTKSGVPGLEVPWLVALFVAPILTWLAVAGIDYVLRKQRTPPQP